MSDIYVGERIRSLREKKNYSRKELAERTGLSAGYLYEIESGRKRFSADVMCKIAEALSASCDYIMFGREVQQNISEKGRVLDSLEAMTPEQIHRVRKTLEMVELLSEVADLI